MIASKSIRLYELTLEFVKDKKKAKEYIDNIEVICEGKFHEQSAELAKKSDITSMNADITRIEADITGIKAELSMLRSDIKSDISDSKVELIKWIIATMITIVSVVVALEKLL